MPVFPGGPRGLLAAENPSYATLARLNGRLDPVELRLVGPGTFEALLAMQRDGAAGANANQIKIPRVLRTVAQQALMQRGLVSEH